MRKLITLISALAIADCISAQELTLFEQIDAEPASEQPAQPMPGMGMQQTGQPAFTLRGTSRFGDEYTTTLINRNGEPVKVKWREGETAPVPGFDGFSIVGVSSRNVSLVHPAFDSCVPAEQNGVSCTDGNTALLGMATAVPLATNGTPPEFGQVQNQPPFMVSGNAMPAGMVDPTMAHDAQAQQVFVNPFNGQTEVINPQSPEDMAARAERQQRRSERLNQFEAVRIDPADVPPGMRLVRTPFGDRLVPARE
jgi:hypothetical protein